jgi:CTP synthase (UTP-ammonia lyase)
VDPYLNVDAGTMNPTEHGEVFVLNSGLETDQDMGNYERFSNKDADDFSYMTSGMVYRDVIEKERNLGYGGKCVEAIPDIRDEIIHRFKKSAKNSGADISIVEIGGTIGDFQNALFYEAARVMKVQHSSDVIFGNGIVFTNSWNTGRNENSSNTKCSTTIEFFWNSSRLCYCEKFYTDGRKKKRKTCYHM